MAKKNIIFIATICMLIIILTGCGITPIKYINSEPRFSDACSTLINYAVCGDVNIKNIDELRRTAQFTFECDFETSRGTFTHRVSKVLVFGEEKEFRCVGEEVRLLDKDVGLGYSITVVPI